jgi:hypothetical protein
LHHDGFLAANHTVSRPVGQGIVRDRQRVQIGDPGRRFVIIWRFMNLLEPKAVNSGSKERQQVGVELVFVRVREAV